MLKTIRILMVVSGITMSAFVMHAFANETVEYVPVEIVETSPVIEIGVGVPQEVIIKVEPFPEEALNTVIETTAASVDTTDEFSESKFTEEELRLLALITMAEAEGESEKGKRLVIDTILNRVDSPKFPNTIHGVIYQKKQFSPVGDGRLKKCYVRDDILQLAREEVKTRLRSDTLYFRTRRYTDSSYSRPLFKEGAHYFSSGK